MESYFDRQRTGGASASTGFVYQDMCALLVLLQHIDDPGFSGIGVETWDDFVVSLGAEEIRVQSKDEQMTARLLKTILSSDLPATSPVPRRTVITSSCTPAFRSFFRRLREYRDHQAHASACGDAYAAVERDFEHLLGNHGLRTVKRQLLRAEFSVLPEDALPELVKAAIAAWGRGRQMFLDEESCITEMLGLLSTARAGRRFLRRARLLDLLHRHVAPLEGNSPAAHMVKRSLDSVEDFVQGIFAHGSEIIARFQSQVRLASAFEKQGEIEKALEIYRPLSLLLDDSEWLLVRCAALSELLGHADQAIQYANKAIKLNGRSFAALCILGTVAGEDGRLDDALGFLRAAEDIDDTDSRLLHNIGYVCLLQRRLDEAIDYFLRAAGEPPTFAPSCLNLGVALFQVARFDEAQFALEKALLLEPNMPEALCQLAEIHRYYGRLDQSTPLFERTLRQCPSNALALQGLGISKLEQGDDAGAGLLLRACAPNLRGLGPDRTTALLDIGYQRVFPVWFTRVREHEIQVQWDDRTVTLCLDVA
ncbi:tetratricopeptide repeat protein [Paraburkholderia sp. Ac-20347]|uniref:tetratricopeptide repeat protein n=1 Tax=Paraburkholderia sp. Ac-20347 TaxID=2703892 RepID=UPI001981AB19|nr:tetratricopeptide repeat protein [Paraburkholderia sp. Ac-20347]MBN3808151.1 tetratricopeptide repeat protein [Paraburkholderia sp. Ac-20347]